MHHTFRPTNLLKKSFNYMPHNHEGNLVCHQVCHQVDLEFSFILGAASAILYCCSGCMCCVLISSHSDFVTGSLNTAKRVPLVKRRSLTLELMINHDKCLIIFVLISNLSRTFRSLRTVTGLVPPSTLLASPWSLAGINFFAV